MVNVNPIAQTSATDATSPQGNLSAYGVTAAKFHGFSKSFVEHGYVFGFVCARADLTYQQGIPRMSIAYRSVSENYNHPFVRPAYDEV